MLWRIELLIIISISLMYNSSILFIGYYTHDDGYQRERGDTPGRPTFICVFNMSTVTLKTWSVGASNGLYIKHTYKNRPPGSIAPLPLHIFLFIRNSLFSGKEQRTHPFLFFILKNIII